MTLIKIFKCKLELMPCVMHILKIKHGLCINLLIVQNAKNDFKSVGNEKEAKICNIFPFILRNEGNHSLFVLPIYIPI